MTIKQLQQKKYRLEKKINEYYSTKKENDDFQWWLKNIKPIHTEIEDIEEQIYRIQLLNLKIGDGVTTWTWTDRYAYTVIARTAKTLTVQRDKAIRTDHNGMSDCQDYRFERNPNGTTQTFRWSEKKGRWVSGCYKLSPGRREYYDFSF